MSDKQVSWVDKMVKAIDKWVHPNEMSHVWNTTYSHIKHMLNNGYLVNRMPTSSYHTSLIIAFLEDACDKAKSNHQDYLDRKAGF